MFEVCVEQTFAAAHALRNYRGKCENVHGHNYRVHVRVTGETLDETGMLIDFIELKTRLREAIERFDHRFLNEIEPFQTVNPSAENIAAFLFQEIAASLRTANGAALEEVKVWETDLQYASYRLPKASETAPVFTPSSS